MPIMFHCSFLTPVTERERERGEKIVVLLSEYMGFYG